MVTKVTSAVLLGVQAYLVRVETDISNGIPYFSMTGVLSTEVKEAQERIRTAIRNSGYKIPSGRVIINVAPAGMPKNGTSLDLPMALGIIAGIGEVPRDELEQYLVMGEVGLDGRVNPVNGVISAVAKAKEAGLRKCIVPAKNSAEANAISDMDIYGVSNIQDAVFIIKNCVQAAKEVRSIKRKTTDSRDLDFSDIAGQYAAKRATMIAAAGRHNLLYIGPPGSGKTMLAERTPGILVEPDEEECLEITKIHSAAGLLGPEGELVATRPFRSPHHTITKVGLLGGGRYPRPGEITLAHRGVLFLDELSLFSSDIIESLRIPIEQKQLNIIRNGANIMFPTDFLLLAAMNPCKCGFYPDRNRCNCTELEIARYMGKISKPILDRFDMMIRVERPKYEQLVKSATKENLDTKTMKQQVENATKIQQQRYAKIAIQHNSQLSSKQISKYCAIEQEVKDLLENIYQNGHMSARGYHKLLKTARTIADLDGAEKIRTQDVTEAYAYRCMDYEGKAGE